MPYEYLRQMPKLSPRWLDEFRTEDAFRPQEFFASRVVYYPGSRTDGHAVKLFGSTHSAHCFVYVDYSITQATLEAELAHPEHGFRGYHTLDRRQLAEADLTPNRWVSHIDPRDVPQHKQPIAAFHPFGFMEVLERDRGFDDAHGARRLAILFLGADGIAAYDALFCQNDSPPVPFAIVLQDHGFGGNYDYFGQGGLLQTIASRCNAIPRFLLVAENTQAWNGFEQVPEVEGDPGGMHATPRFLYRRHNA
jgi:hypothetical protein